jgi:hypothetical protein
MGRRQLLLGFRLSAKEQKKQKHQQIHKLLARVNNEIICDNEIICENNK